MKRLAKVLLFVLLAVALGLVARKYVFGLNFVAGDSMKETLQTGDLALITKLDYRLHPPQRGDVALLTVPGRDGTYLKRVIGLPGETVELKGGETYINGERLNEPYATNPGADYAATLGADEYFVLGDTPANSEDSRSSTIGAVKRAQIIGKAWLAAKSLTEIRLIHGQ